MAKRMAIQDQDGFIAWLNEKDLKAHIENEAKLQQGLHHDRKDLDTSRMLSMLKSELGMGRE